MNRNGRVGLIECFDLNGGDVDLDVESVWRSLESSRFSRSKMVIARLEELLPIACSLIDLRAIGRIFAGAALDARDAQGLPETIHGAEYVCFGLTTAGAVIDERARELRARGDLVDSMILDAVATAGLSLIGDRLGRTVSDWASKRGLSTSRGFSPGAGASGWDLSNQRLVFAHLPTDPLGVQLTSHYLMIPSKSVSFVLGIGKGVRQASHLFSCEGCDRLDCAYRHGPPIVGPSGRRAIRDARV